jgi:hypothetical protein
MLVSTPVVHHANQHTIMHHASEHTINACYYMNAAVMHNASERDVTSGAMSDRHRLSVRCIAWVPAWPFVARESTRQSLDSVAWGKCCSTGFSYQGTGPVLSSTEAAC